MKFRDMEIDDVIVVGPFAKELFVHELKRIHEEYTVIDLQYSVIVDKHDTKGHCALALVKEKDDG